MPKLSEPKRNALQAIRDAGSYRLISAGTIGSLERARLITQDEFGRYRLTEDGEEALAS